MFRTHTPIHVVALLPLLMLSTGFAEELPAKGMSPLPYGRQELGKETTVKQSLADPGFKLRKLNKDHYLYFKQLSPTATQVAAMKELKAPEWTVPIIAMEMKRIPAGEFVMGSPTDERYHRKDEVQHTVKISKPFYMGTCELTQRQFYYLTIPDYDFRSWMFSDGPVHVGSAMRHRNSKRWGDHLNEELEFLKDNPMECFSWRTAVKYCERLTEFERRAGRLPNGYAYRLPTEAEWEYACRAGTTSYFNTGADLEELIAKNTKVQSGHAFVSQLPDLGKFAFNGGWPGSTTIARQPNRFGLQDMHGNVYEYTLDTYAPYPTDGKPQVDPVNWENEANQDVFVNEKVIRGGSCMLHLPRPKPDEKIEELTDQHYHYENLRSAARNSIPYDFDYNTITGMRIVLAPKIDIPIPTEPTYHTLATRKKEVEQQRALKTGN
jgi:formylglycine-generating enzyme required for sulfatase activity